MKNLNKLMKNLEEIKKYTKYMSSDISDYYGEELLDDVAQKCGVSKNKKPKTKKRYVGVEIEFTSKASRLDIFSEMIKLKITEKVNVVSDCSIRTRGLSKGHEIKVLDTEKGIHDTLRKVGILLSRIKAKTNNSCGLHVHLDMRSRKVDRCFKNLERSQQLLFSLVSTSRRNNDYCYYTVEGDNEFSRSAINRGSYNKHKTLEVRMHHSTTDAKVISNWVKLLIKIVNVRRELDEVKDLKDLEKNKIKLEAASKTYIKKKYKKYSKPKCIDYYNNSINYGNSFANRW